MDPSAWQAIQDLGTAGMLAFALIGGARGWYVWKREHDAVRTDRDFWRATALQALGHTDKALEVAAKGRRDA